MKGVKKINKVQQVKQNKKMILIDYVKKFKQMRKILNDKLAKEDTVEINKLKKLMTHEKHERVMELKNNPFASFSVRSPKNEKMITFPGLTVRLKEIYYPTTEDNPRKKSKEDKQNRKGFKNYKPTGMKSTCSTSGSIHGSLVHGQLERFVNILSINARILEQDPTQYTWLEDADPCLIRILARFISEMWVPVYSELKIWDENIHIQTAVDCMVFDIKRDKNIMIELKTNFEGEVYGSHPNDAPLPIPFEKIQNCPKNRHMLQVSGMRMILKKSYGICISECYILRTLSKLKGSSLIPLEQWAKNKESSDILYESLRKIK